MRRAHSYPTIEAPRYGRGASAAVAAARSIAALMTALTDSKLRAGFIQVEQHGEPQIPISSLSSSGANNGPPAAALVWRAITSRARLAA